MVDWVKYRNTVCILHSNMLGFKCNKDKSMLSDVIQHIIHINAILLPPYLQVQCILYYHF